MISLNLQTGEPLAPISEDPEAVASTQSSARKPDLDAIAERLDIALGNRFEVLTPLAIGGMATILQLRHRLHRGLFVAKVLHAWLAEQPGFRGRFRAEAMHSAALAGHPHAVSTIDLGEIDGLFYMVFPYIDGEDLDGILSRVHHLERGEALTLAAHMASILQAAAANGISHCDISPGNIRLDRHGMYRLMDFGLSRRSGEETVLAGSARTPLYASPEQWRNESPDVRSDLYSLGVVLLESLTGVPPFLADSESAIQQRHLSGDWSLPPALQADPSLAALISGLLAVDREQRLQSAGELAAALSVMGHATPDMRSLPLNSAAPATPSHPRAAEPPEPA